MRRRAAPTWPGTKAWTCAGEDRNEATRAPAKNIDMDVKRTEPTRRSGLKMPTPKRSIGLPETFYTRLGADSGNNQTDGKGLIAHGSGNRILMGERINNVHGSLIPCQYILIIIKKMFESPLNSLLTICSLASHVLKEKVN